MVNRGRRLRGLVNWGRGSDLGSDIREEDRSSGGGIRAAGDEGTVLGKEKWALCRSSLDNYPRAYVDF